MDKIDLQKLEELNNQHVIKLVEEAIQLCKPAKVVVITDSKEDIAYVRELASILSTLMVIMIKVEIKPIPSTCCLKM
jgi:GTP-dependent phosphoenolpyruvate carboxykinase